MAINPPSDIVLGSMRAADPDKYQAAAARLRRLALDAPPATLAAGGSRRAAALPATATPRRAASDAFSQLEAFVLKTFIESMLPANAETAFGKGTAGEIWKSMLAEQLANEMARSGQVGLARRLAQGAEGFGFTAAAGASAEVPAQPPPPAPSLPETLPYLGQEGGGAPQSDDAPSMP
ncbi:MAG TPA: rod-binding protein [Hyphomicrobiaceae bacterium]|nr:rod-binding protein [Hyphomicrobiaceae bacterium]